ncbi:MAG: T9SS type A sorting domain-containing protein, partial [Ignavibacteriae bacterium]|nr:T9SS type A sorting domain-containing protein [Ignavibacteriota bacterium]
TTNIKYQITNNSYVILKVYDILGREVATLVNEKLNPATYDVPFSNDKLSSGVYFYKLTTDEFSDAKRMILVK